MSHVVLTCCINYKYTHLGPCIVKVVCSLNFAKDLYNDLIFLESRGRLLNTGDRSGYLLCHSAGYNVRSYYRWRPILQVCIATCWVRTVNFVKCHRVWTLELYFYVCILVCSILRVLWVIWQSLLCSNFEHHSSLLFSLVEFEEVSATVWHKQLQHFWKYRSHCYKVWISDSFRVCNLSLTE